MAFAVLVTRVPHNLNKSTIIGIFQVWRMLILFKELIHKMAVIPV